MTVHDDVFQPSTAPPADGMHALPTRSQPWRPHHLTAQVVCAVLTFLAFAGPPRLALAQTAKQEALIEVLFGELSPTDDLDANHDGAPTVADSLLLGPENPSPPTPTATPTDTPTPTETFTPTPSPTPTGMLFTGTIA